MKVTFTKLQPLPDPSHGTPSARSSHGLSCMTVNSKLCLVLLFGEHVCRTPLSLDEAIWFAETTEAVLPQDEINWNKIEWKWRLVDTTKQRPLMDVPQSRLAHSQVAVGDYIYIFGGRVGVDMNETSLGDLWKFHVPSESWTLIDAKTKQQLPEARSFHKMSAIGNYIYVFGGCGASGKRLNDLHRFDTIQCQWCKLDNSSLLAGRGGPNLFTLKHSEQESSPYLAVVAGFKGEETKDGHVFHITSSSWADSTMQGLSNLRPRSVSVFGSFTIANVGIIFGGEVDPSERGHEGAGGFTNDLVLIDGVTETIIDTVSAPDPCDNNSSWPESRGWADGDIYESKEGNVNCLFLFGGLAGDDESPRRLDDLWVCNLY